MIPFKTFFTAVKAAIYFVVFFVPLTSYSFWVVNFGTARTLAPHRIGFAAGMGGQLVFIGNPQKMSAFFTIPHAGFRFGLAKGLDCGLRLAPIPEGFWEMLHGSRTDWAMLLGSIFLIIKGSGNWSIDKTLMNKVWK